jgi:hypothetical protein
MLADQNSRGFLLAHRRWNPPADTQPMDATLAAIAQNGVMLLTDPAPPLLPCHPPCVLFFVIPAAATAPPGAETGPVRRVITSVQSPCRPT